MERYHIFKLGLAILFYAVYCIRPMMVNALKIDDAVGSTSNETKNFIEEDFVYYQGVQGKPGIDFPVLSHIPRTTFNCRNVDSGYYADLETECQVFHICEEGKKISFLCPNGTIFQQSELICEWWFKVNCTNSPNLYEESAEQLREETARRKASRRVFNHGAVMRTEEHSSVSASQNGRSFETRRRDRVSNHSPTYRTEKNEDLARASSSDFVRDRERHKPAPFSTSLPPKQDQNQQYQERTNQIRNGRRKQKNQLSSQQSNSNFDDRRTENRFNNQQNFRDANSRSTTETNFYNQNQQASTLSDNGFKLQSSFDNKVNNQQNLHNANNRNEAKPSTENQFNRQNHQASAPSDNGFKQQSLFNNNKLNNQQDTNKRNQAIPTTENSFYNRNKLTSVSSDNGSKQQSSFNNNKFNNQQNFHNTNHRNDANSATENNFNNQNHQASDSSDNGSKQQSSFNNNKFNNQQNFHNTNHRNDANSATENNFYNQNQHASASSGNGFKQQSSFSDDRFNKQQNLHNANNRNDAKPTTENNFYNQKQQTFASSDNGSKQQSSSNNNNKFNDQQNFRNTNHRIDANSGTENNFYNQNQHTSGSSGNGFKQQSSFSNNRFNNQQNLQNANNRNKAEPTTESNFYNQNQQASGSSGNGFKQQSTFNNNNYHQSTENYNKNVGFQHVNTFNEEFGSEAENKPFGSGFDQNKAVAPEKQRSNSVREDRKLTPSGFKNQNQFGNNQKTGSEIDNTKNRNTGFSTTDSTTNQQNQNHDVPPHFHWPGNCTFAAHFHQSEKKTEPVSTSFPNLQAEDAFNTGAQKQNTKVLPLSNTHKSKDGTTKQKSTVPLTRNDIVNRRLEPNESDEAQIPQETASFFKNSFNRIDQDIKTTSPNPHPNHRETYSDLKEPQYYSTKILSAISSVTPQYLTTQPINNGKPFIGSQVGTTLSKSQGTTTTEVPTTTTFVVGRSDFGGATTVTTFSPSTTTGFQVSTTTSTTTTKPKIEISTKKVVDHATVYGKFVKSSATTPTPEKVSIFLSKSLIGGTSNSVTANPLSIQSTQKAKSSTTPKASSSKEILSTSHTSNSAVPQVRFYGKVNSSTTKSSGVKVRINGNSLSTTPKPRISSTASTYRNSFSTTPKPVSVSEKTYLSTSPLPLSISTAQQNSFTSFGTTPRPFISTTSSGVSGFTHSSTLARNSGTTPGFYVTKNSATTTGKSVVGDIVRPRPFQLPPEPDYKGQAVYGSTKNSVTPTRPTYKISSASPFTVPSSPVPTQPTLFSTAKPALPSTFENVDTMINALAEMANRNHSSDSPRPGLVIPPSAGPQTLHTLAQYFANALDGIVTDKEEDDESEDESDDNLTEKELEKKRLTELLTQMTMNRYNELFSEDKEEETTTITSRMSDEEDNDLEGQHSKSPVTTPKVRQLAKVFTQALSSYLDDPTTFKKVLEEVRPTEPPVLDKDETTDLGDDELLNFSDADVKSSFPPFFPTPRPPRPTWGYLITFNTSQNLDVKNSITGDTENLQGADSQSLVSQLNKLQQNKETTTKSSVQLPDDHWTTSPGVAKLWTTAFAFDPASINENFGTTEPIATTTEPESETLEPIEQPHHEIKYELRALPQLDLNSTQVHGILIDFMNTTRTHHENRLQRILRKLNTTEDEFLTKMKEIEGNPLTRRLILLLISECGNNQTPKTHAVPLHALLQRNLEKNKEILETSSSVAGFPSRERQGKDAFEKSSSDLKKIVDSSLDDDSQDARALQLLNSLYTIASRFGKK